MDRLRFEHEWLLDQSRRTFLGRMAGGLGAAALSTLLGPVTRAAAVSPSAPRSATDLPHFAPRAKRVIYLFQSGGPSQIDLFDFKPVLRELHATELPDSVRGGQRVTGMTAGQRSFPVVAPPFEFSRYGAHGTWVSELLPNTARVVDDICILKGVHTEAINHDPGITYINTGDQQPGKASLGSWLSYGLGSENRDLPAYIVMLSQGTGKDPGQPLFSRLWGSGFLPSSHQGVQLRPGANPVLYLSNPPGIDAAARRHMLDDLARLNARWGETGGDPEVTARIGQYEMAFRMQSSVPDLTDLSDEPESTFELYGPDSRVPGTFAANCLLARRLAERGVRFVQLFHRGWDQPRSPRAVLHDLDGRRRREGGLRARPHRRLRLERGRRGGAHPRPERDDPPPARHRPRAPDLPVPGARPEADRRRAGPRRRRDTGLSRRQPRAAARRIRAVGRCRASAGRAY
jgi:hypothetical protein